MKKKPLIFISHSSKNKDQVAKIADLLRSINLSPRRDIFCSSLPGYGIPNGANIFDFSGMKGVIGSDCIAIKLDGDRSEVKDRLNQLRRELESEFDISDNEDIIWEEARDKFISEIFRLAAK